LRRRDQPIGVAPRGIFGELAVPQQILLASGGEYLARAHRNLIVVGKTHELAYKSLDELRRLRKQVN